MLLLRGSFSWIDIKRLLSTVEWDEQGPCRAGVKPEIDLLFFEPRAGPVDVLPIEVADSSPRVGLAEQAHGPFPALVSDQRDALQVREVMEVGLEVFPESSGLPAMEIDHFQKNADLAVVAEVTLELRREAEVIHAGELPAQAEDQDVRGTLFGEVD